MSLTPKNVAIVAVIAVTITAVVWRIPSARKAVYGA